MKILLPCILLVLLVATRPLPAQTGTAFLTGTNLDWMSSHTGALYWKARCGGVPGSIARAPTAGIPAVHTYFAPPTCNGFSVRSANIAMDAQRNVYWATEDGRIVTLAATAGPADTPVVLGQMASTAHPQSVHVSVSAAYVYWAESFGEILGNGTIYRVPIGGGARQTLITLSSATGGGAVLLHAMGNNGVTFGETILYKRAFGKFARGVEQAVLPGQEPFTEATLAATVDTFRVVGGRVYYAQTTTGAATLIRSRNATTQGTANIQTHATLSTAGFPIVSDLAADANAVYWREARNNAGPIWRQLFAGGTPEQITDIIPNLTGDRIFLESDGRHLFWRASQSEIRTLPVGAGAIVYDLEGRALEVVQAIQGPANDVPLVAGKATWVRAFGRFSVTGSLATVLNRQSFAQLHGSVGGVPLPGSPLQPVGGDGYLHLHDADRTYPGAGAWYRLPPEWTAEGQTELRAEFNADRAVSENNFSNNSVQGTFTFNRRLPIHLKIYPLRTTEGTIGSYSPNYQPVFDLAEAMLPTPRLTFEFGGTTIEEWNPPLPWDFGPYELSKTDDDSDWVLFKLGLRAVFSWASAGSKVHDIAFFPLFGDRFANGYGRVGSPMVMICNMDLTDPRSGFNNPRGGVTLAHEMGHNYGRKHVNCGNPSGIDYGYTYHPCRLAGDEPDDVPYQGWNPLTQRLILGHQATDLMAYRDGYRWTSDYTWLALYDGIGSGLASPAGAGDRGVNDPMLLGAVVRPSGFAEIHPAVPLPEASSQANAAKLVSDADDQTTWSFDLRRADGTLIANIPAGGGETSDEGSILVYAVAGEQPEAATVTLLRNNAPGIPQATLAGGGQPPVIALTAPAAGTVAAGNLTIMWNASDPEGQPLRFQVRHTHDGGASWTMVADEVRQNEFTVDTTTLPGGAANQSRIEVLASDGLRTAVAQSEFFTIPPQPPRPLIVLETERGRTCSTVPSIAAGETLFCRGSANDAEDGPLPDASLAWSVTSPNVPARLGSGREIYLRDLLPGTYSVEMTAIDSDGQSGLASASFVVRPVAMETPATVPVMDGYCDDAAYLTCLHPLPIRGTVGEVPATVRAVLRNTTIYVSVTGLPVGIPSPDDYVAISFDPNNSGGTSTQATDIRFIVTRDGSFRAVRPDGSGFEPPTSAPGYLARAGGSATRWQAEFAIPLATLGAGVGQIVGMEVQHFRSGSPGPGHFPWLGGATTSWNRPSDWADTRLGPDPDDPADLDLDGIADTWEIANFGDTTGLPDHDTDRDGQSDLEEYHSGTDPKSAASRFETRTFTKQGNLYLLDWQSVLGRTYTVETSNTLDNWTPYRTGLRGTGEVMSCLIDPALPEAGRFFRINAERCFP